MMMVEFGFSLSWLGREVINFLVLIIGRMLVFLRLVGVF